MKIIGSDYDGTLNHNGIDDKKKKAIEKWRRAGNVFAVISGRGAEELLELYNGNSFGCDYLVADSGAVIMKTDGTRVCDTRCDKKLVRPLLEMLFEEGCPWGDVHADVTRKIYREEADGEVTLENMGDVPFFTQISTMLDDFESAARVTKRVRDAFGDKLNPLQNGRCIDIVRRDMNKAEGLCLLAQIAGAKRENIIAVGDNVNDMDMIKAFRSYAMKSGVDSVKKAATFVTEGVTELIEKELESENMIDKDILEIIFIRHAETEYTNIGDRDNCDGELTEKGEEQCRLLGEKLKNVPIDAYITSSLLRAFKTAAGVCRAKSDGPLLEICPELIECGCTEGYFGCSEEYLNKYYKNTKTCESLYGKDRHEFPCEGKEVNDIRAKKVMDYLKKRFTYGQRVAVFSHHGFLEHLIPTALGVEPHLFRFSLENISMNVVQFTSDGKCILKSINKI